MTERQLNPTTENVRIAGGVASSDFIATKLTRRQWLHLAGGTTLGLGAAALTAGPAEASQRPSTAISGSEIRQTQKSFNKGDLLVNLVILSPIIVVAGRLLLWKIGQAAEEDEREYRKSLCCGEGLRGDPIRCGDCPLTTGKPRAQF